MSSYLIPYIDPRKMDGHEDPMFDEYTYGDVGRRGKILIDKVKKGDFLFFHTRSKNQRIITAYYYVEEVMPVAVARDDDQIKIKYRNPHLKTELLGRNDTIVFGNPVRSLKLRTPLPLTRSILNKFSRKVNLNNKQTELAAISSALRSWKELDKDDVDMLIKEISVLQKEERLKDIYLSNEEILQLDEIDIEDFLVYNPKNLNKDYEYIDRQVVLNSNRRIDVLLKNKIKKELIVVEIKKGLIGKDVYKQIQDYMKEIGRKAKTKYGLDKVKGIIVCNGILPTFEEFYFDLLANRRILK